MSLRQFYTEAMQNMADPYSKRAAIRAWHVWRLRETR